MQIEEIEIVISPNGNVELAVHGIKGPSCLDLTQALEDVLGNVILARELTPEALEGPEQNLPTGDQTVSN